MKEGLVHLCFVIDESGSMYRSIDDVVGGFKQMIEEQKQSTGGDCIVSMFRFSNNVKTDFIGKNVHEISEDLEYTPRGNTAMNDGIGTAIDTVGKWLSDMEENERPSHNMIIIMTDGAENFSKEYTLDAVKEKIKHQEEKYSWSFVYLGINVTTLQNARDLGIKLSSVTSRNKVGEYHKAIGDTTRKLRCATNVSEAVATMDSFNSTLNFMTAEYEVENNLKV